MAFYLVKSSEEVAAMSVHQQDPVNHFSSLISGLGRARLGGKLRAALVNTSPHLSRPRPLGNVPRQGCHQHLTENTWERPT